MTNVRKVQDSIKTLKEHQKFLEKKLSEKEESKSHYLRRELLALTWVIRYAEDTLIEAADHQYQWFTERRGNG